MFKLFNNRNTKWCYFEHLSLERLKWQHGIAGVQKVLIKIL